MAKRDYYEILGIEKSSSKEEIKKAYKKLALKHHPDKGGDEEKFKEISEAYAVLSDDTKKSTYDQFGHTGFDQRYSQEDIFRNANFEDIFSEIFGGQGQGSIFDMFFGGNRKRKGSDLRYDLEIEFEEAAFGTEKEISLNKLDYCNICNGSGSEDGEMNNCETCNGQGRMQRRINTPFGQMSQVTTCSNCKGQGKIIKNKCHECDGDGVVKQHKTLKVKVPAGADDGTSLRISEEGEPGDAGKGDLYIVLHVKPSKTFKRDGEDLFLEVPITFSQAALGDEITIPTLTGKEKIKIPSGIQSGTILKLKNHGIESLDGYGKGDILITIEIQTPKRLSKDQKELFKKLDKLEDKKTIFDKLKERIP